MKCADDLSRKQSDSFKEMHDVIASYRGIHLDAKEASCLKALAVFNSGKLGYIHHLSVHLQLLIVKIILDID